MITLNEPQAACVKDIHRILLKEKQLCLAWYTGSGKTNIFLQYCAEMIKAYPDIKIGISSYLTKEIKEQVYERALTFDLGTKAHMVMVRKNIPTDKNLYIFNPQTLYRAEDLEIKFDLIIVDESHIGTQDPRMMIRTIIDNYSHNQTRYLFCSATPWDFLAVDEFGGLLHKVFQAKDWLRSSRESTRGCWCSLRFRCCRRS